MLAPFGYGMIVVTGELADDAAKRVPQFGKRILVLLSLLSKGPSRRAREVSMVLEGQKLAVHVAGCGAASSSKRATN